MSSFGIPTRSDRLISIKNSVFCPLLIRTDGDYVDAIPFFLLFRLLFSGI